jgi:hypothetical protein
MPTKHNQGILFVKFKSFFQHFTSFLIGLAIVFGCLATPAFADVKFSAPDGAQTHHSYFVFPTGIEIGVIYSDDNQGSTDKRVLMCNNAYGQPKTGAEWQSTCSDPQALPASTRLRVQAYYKPTSPGTIRWRCAIPDYRLTEEGFEISWNSEDAQQLTLTTIIGDVTKLNNTKPICQSNDLDI